MRIQEITTIKPSQPLTPAQGKINALKQQKERASTELKAERESQKRAKATQKIQQAQKTISDLNKNE
jgi:hypothetical protein